MSFHPTSPLRYPGGKACLYKATAEILHLNRLDLAHYVEPYAGGAGLALSLLFNGHVGDIHLNDVDRAIWSFWNAVLNDTERLVEAIAAVPVNIEEWQKQRDIYSNPDMCDDFTLGFSAFFLNRTNRSGIIKNAGAIGGFNQTGNYKIDCRFKKESLIKRIERIAQYKTRIHIYRLDACDFIDKMKEDLPITSFFCIDPPYYNKGSSLYTSFYKPDDHLKVSQKVLGLDRPWILTYDNTPEISKLYETRRQFSFDVNYTLQTKRVGKELLVVSKNLRIPSEIRENLVHRPQYKAA